MALAENIGQSHRAVESRRKDERNVTVGRRPQVLVVDDESKAVLFATRALTKAGFDVVSFDSAKGLVRGLGELLPDAICLDLSLTQMGGFDALKLVRRHHQTVPIVVLTNDGAVSSVVKAMQAGAFDYLTKPVSAERLTTSVRHAVERFQLETKAAQWRREAQSETNFGGIVGGSRCMLDLYAQLDKVAVSDISVLLHGESGTGKELVARAVHDRSPRSKGPFVAMNCAAVAETLQDSELFGHEKGAFTGASSRKIGRFEQAHRGTLFLDEVAELSLGLQAKLLRALQERTIDRVGGTEPIAVDFRIIAASHQDLAQRVRDGRFREDLFFRIAVFEVELPPLRERTDDIPLLAGAFLAEFSTADTPQGLPPEVLGRFSRYHWPGNVRELRNVIHRALVSASGATMSLADLPLRVQSVIPKPTATAVVVPSNPRFSDALIQAAETEAKRESLVPGPNRSSRPAGPQAPASERVEENQAAKLDLATTNLTLAEIEKWVIVTTLELEEGNVSAVIRRLGIGRTTLYRKLKQYKLR